MAKSTLSPPEKVKRLLITLLVIVILGGGALFYFMLDTVRSFAVDVDHTIADSEASGMQIRELQVLKGQISESESLISKANQIFSTPDGYQTQSLNDIRRYADIAGLTIEKTSFGEETAADTRSITVNLQAPVSYNKLIRFLDGIEGNVPKIQVASITLDHVVGGGADTVKVGDIVLKIAIR